MVDLLWSVARIALLSYAGILLLVYFRQSKYIYYPDRVIAMTPAEDGLAFENLRLRTRDGETIAAWYVPAPTNAGHALTLIDCHGNAGDIGDRVMTVRTFHDLGMNVLIFDYRGYGESTGTPTEAGTYLDAQAAWDYLVQTRCVPTNEIVVFGRSLGGAVAAWLAQRVNPAALVIESSFTSAQDMARQMFPYLPIRWLCSFRYDALAAIRQVHCPVLIAHSIEDDMIPFAHGRRLFAAANEPKQFVEMRGDHNAGGLDIDPGYQQIFRTFIATHLTPPARQADLTAHP